MLAEDRTTERMLVFLIPLVVAAGKVYVPGKSVIIQYGKARTATTAQWSILCFLARIKNYNAGVPPPGCDLIAKTDVLGATPLATGVYKTHYYENVEAALGVTDDVMVFETLPRDGGDDIKNHAAERHVLYLQEFNQMQTCPLSTVHDYAATFNLTIDEEMRARAHFRYWDVHRLCCGDQAAVAYRMHLHGCPPVYKWYDDKQPNCEMYDLAAVEARLVESENFDSPVYADLNVRRDVKSKCDLQNDEVRNGAEFSGHRFTTCLDLARKWIRDPIELSNYKCLNHGQC